MLGQDGSAAIYNLQGALVQSKASHGDAAGYRNMLTDWSRRFNPENHVLRISNGKDVLTQKLDAFPTPMP